MNEDLKKIKERAESLAKQGLITAKELVNMINKVEVLDDLTKENEEKLEGPRYRIIDFDGETMLNKKMVDLKNYRIVTAFSTSSMMSRAILERKEI